MLYSILHQLPSLQVSNYQSECYQQPSKQSQQEPKLHLLILSFSRVIVSLFLSSSHIWPSSCTKWPLKSKKQHSCEIRNHKCTTTNIIMLLAIYIKEFLGNLPLSILSEFNFLESTQLRENSRKYWITPNILAMKNLMLLTEKRVCLQLT